MDEETIKAFLVELTELTRRYKLSLGACGCCGGINIYKEPDPASGEYTSEGQDSVQWRPAQ